jgi:hypothetical protein
MNKFDFFCPRARYKGEPVLEHRDFNFHFQYFANRVSLLCGLQTGGKISPSDAYLQLNQLWEDFQMSVTPDLNHLNSGLFTPETTSIHHASIETEEV